MPLFVTSRLDNWENRCGIQESSAMFARTRGPSKKPVWAATKSKAASETRQRMTKEVPNDQLPILQVPKRLSKRTAFMVFPSAGRELVNIYPNRMPPAVNASETAIRNIVFLPVFTLGSRSIVIPLETASIPV